MSTSPAVGSYDVVMVSDLRFPGGTSSSLAEEIAAQASAGYRTGLVHIPGPLVAGLRPLNPKLVRCVEEGLADLVVGRRAIDARLLVMR
ncbi:MAG: glycosyl transferase, partial [Chloroflexi bacterium]|nr:glycosyl transferase [Chloroflexota bacterium]